MTTPTPALTAAVTALASATDALTAIPAGELCVTELQTLIAGVAPQAGRLTGLLTVLSGALQARTGGTVPTEGGTTRKTAGWLAETTGSTASAAGAQIRTGTRLAELPRVQAAVLAGTVGPEQAAVLTRLIGQIDPAALAEAEPALVQVAAGRDPHALGQYVAHLIATHVEPAHDSDAGTAHDKRYLTHRRERDGSLRGSFRLAPEDAETVLTALEPLARPTGKTDPRTAAQRRADALVDACDLVLRTADLSQCGRHRPQLSYVLPAGWAAQPRTGSRWDTPSPGWPSFADTVRASLPGHPGIPAEHACGTAAWTGPQTRSRIETILCDTRISRVLLTPAGQVSGLETLGDTVTPAQRRALAARDLGCAARGCTRPPASCDAHHLIALADGGPTTLGNLVLLCRRHHVLWHQGKLHLHDLHVPWLQTSINDPPVP